MALGRLLTRLGSSYHPILTPLGGLQEAKIDEKSIMVVVKNKKSENVDFLHLSLAKSMFLEPNGSRDGGPK